MLRRIKELGATHVWYTGVIRHATTTDYTRYGIPRQHPAVVKGNAGSPYAITDYYDIDPDLATNVEKRMNEFESLVKRTHKAGLKMIIDFVPNHLARQYKSTAKPKGIADFGENDNTGMQFSPQNNFYYCPEQSLQPTSISIMVKNYHTRNSQPKPQATTASETDRAGTTGMRR